MTQSSVVAAIILLSTVLNNHVTLAKPIEEDEDLRRTQLELWSDLGKMASKMVQLLDRETSIEDNFVVFQDDDQLKIKQLPSRLHLGTQEISTDLRPVPAKRYRKIFQVGSKRLIRFYYFLRFTKVGTLNHNLR